MPILWRYILKSFFKVFFLCVAVFICVLIVLRFQEIARFATSGADPFTVLFFSLFQIPYILPIAIPISCLISAMLLFQTLSHTHELTAFRTSGLGLRAIITPLMFTGALLSLLNFTICNELAPRSRGYAKTLILEMAAANPLFLLQKESLIKLKNAYIDIKMMQAGRKAEDILLVVKNTSSERLGILSAQELCLKGKLMHGKNVTFISSVDQKGEGGFDHLIIENQKEMDTEAANLSQFVSDVGWSVAYDYLPLRLILAKEAVIRNQPGMPHSISRSAASEISRRLSLSLAAFTFTIMGVAFGMQISRTRSRKGMMWALLLATLYMVCFIMAKSLKHSQFLTISIYLLPHPLMMFFSLRYLKTVREGVE